MAIDWKKLEESSQRDSASSGVSLRDDMLAGANEIGEFMGLSGRAIYHAADHNGLPVFRIGTKICARKSTILRWIEEQEASVRGPKQ